MNKIIQIIVFTGLLLFLAINDSNANSQAIKEFNYSCIKKIEVVENSSSCTIFRYVDENETIIYNVVAAVVTNLLPDVLNAVCERTVGDPDICNTVYDVTSMLISLRGKKVYKGISKGLESSFNWIANKSSKKSRATIETRTYTIAGQIKDVFESYKARCTEGAGIPWENIYTEGEGKHSSENKDKYNITDLVYGGGKWVVSASKTGQQYSQISKAKTYFPKDDISRLWKNKYDITNLSYGNGTWSLIMSKESGYGKQKWTKRDYFPKKEISEAWKSGYDITDFTYGDGKWVVVFSKGVNLGKQKWTKRNYFPKKEISEAWDNGYKVTNLVYGGGYWVVVFSTNSNFSRQKWIKSSSFPKEKISASWEKKYDITSITYGEGGWIVFMSKGSEYTKQAWRVRNNFPQEEVNELRNR